MNAQVPPPRIQSAYSQWVAASRGEINAIYLARMLAAQREGHSALSSHLGLDAPEFAALLDFFFPEPRPLSSAFEPAPVAELPEMPQLETLLNSFRAGRCESEVWLARILASACAGQEHLWYDLGLWNREDLQNLLRHNFPELVRRNSLDMKWKKFLYRQLCLETGATLCRAPSCQECSDFVECFGPE